MNPLFGGRRRAPRVVLARVCLLGVGGRLVGSAAVAGLILLTGWTHASEQLSAKSLEESGLAGAPCLQIRSAPAVHMSVGKSQVWRAPSPVLRVVLGNPDHAPAARSARPADPSPGSAVQATTGALSRSAPVPPPAPHRPGVADVDLLLLAPQEMVLQARSLGTTNFVLVGGAGQCTTLDVVVGMDTTWLQSTIERLLPAEKQVQITPAFDAVVLTGAVSDSEALARVTELTQAFLRSHDGGGSATRRMVNLLEVGAPQQVMLEVKVAEVSKALIDKLGVQFSASDRRGQWTYNLLADFLTGGGGLAGLAKASGTLGVQIDAQKDDALVKVLAEPTVMALSGQTGSFLAGGKVFIPVAQDPTVSGGRSVTLEEKEFGVSLRFTPTVMGSGRIHLQVRPEVSELNREGVGIAATGVAGTAVLPSFTSRRAETTVQLMDGQSFAIGGLIRNNATTSVKAFPFLGELPIIGALFRSTQFQADRSELVFVITPRLVKPLPANYRLPTDDYVPPSRSQRIFEGRLEGGAVVEGVTQELRQSQHHDHTAAQVRGQAVAPTDARLLKPAAPAESTGGRGMGDRRGGLLDMLNP